MEQIVIETKQLQATADTMEELLKAARAEISSLYDAAEELDMSWTGPANQTFQQQFADDRHAALEMCDLLQRFLQSMEYACTLYDNCEKNVCDIVDAIRI